MSEAPAFSRFSAVLSACVLLLVSLLPPALAEENLAQSPVPRSLLLEYLADNSVFTLVDARTMEEFASSHITGAINLPHDASEEQFAALPPANDALIVVYCKTGTLAAKLRERLALQGYNNVRVLSPTRIFWFDEMAVFNCGTDGDDDVADGIVGMLNRPSTEEEK